MPKRCHTQNFTTKGQPLESEKLGNQKEEEKIENYLHSGDYICLAACMQLTSFTENSVIAIHFKHILRFVSSVFSKYCKTLRPRPLLSGIILSVSIKLVYSSSESGALNLDMHYVLCVINGLFSSRMSQLFRNKFIKQSHIIN